MELDEEREQQYDLLTAAIIGAAVGAGITLHPGDRPALVAYRLPGR